MTGLTRLTTSLRRRVGAIKRPGRQRTVTILAVAALALSVAVGAAAVLNRDDRARPIASPDAAVTTEADSTPPQSKSKPGRKGHGAKRTAAAGAGGAGVDPRTGKSFCDTARLLGLYAGQDYGLSQRGEVVSGEKFRARLQIVAETYRRLSDQAEEPATAASWGALAAGAEHAEETLRAVGLNVHSQIMIAELAELADLTRRKLPTATSRLGKLCGKSAEAMGLGA